MQGLNRSLVFEAKYKWSEFFLLLDWLPPKDKNLSLFDYLLLAGIGES